MQPIIVIGMHRSGTSLVTSVLEKMGVFMGNDLDNNNESEHFNRLNNWIIFQAGATWDNPYNFNFITDDFVEKVTKNLEKHLIGYKNYDYLGDVRKVHKYKSLKGIDFQWGWKDPINTFTIEIWKKLFPDAKIVHVYRNPVDVALSLQAREKGHLKIYNTKTRTGVKKYFNERTLWKKRIYYHSIRVLNLQEGIKLWEQYVGKALSLASSSDFLNVCYEDFLLEPEKQIDKLSNFVGAGILREKSKEITKTINSSRRFAFVDNADHIKIYEGIKDKPLLQQLGYDKIIL